MYNNPGLNAAMSAMAISNSIRASQEAARADQAEEALSDIIDTEAKSLGSVISKKKMFREAADEMTRDLSQKLSRGLADDLDEIKGRKGLFSIFKTAVPSDVLQMAKVEGQKYFNDFVHDSIVAGDIKSEVIARHGVCDEELYPYYESGRGVEFFEGLDESEVVAIAKLGVINMLQYELDDIGSHEGFERGEKETRQQFRATVHAFAHAADKAYDICEELKKPYEQRVISNGPASMPEGP